MKKFLFLALVALVACAGIASAQANLGENYSASKTFRLTRSAPTTNPWYTATWSDTMTIASSADTVRTENINTDGWDWLSTLSTGATSPRAVAFVEFYTPPGTTATCAGDTLYYAVEPSFDGGQTYIINGSAMPVAVGSSAGVGNYANITNPLLTYTGTGGVLYRGMLVIDVDSALLSTGNQQYFVQGYRDFRLKIFGDAAQVGPIRCAVYPVTAKFAR